MTSHIKWPNQYLCNIPPKHQRIYILLRSPRKWEAATKTMGCSSQTGKVHCWRQLHTFHWTQSWWADAYIESWPPHFSIFGMERYSTGYQKRNINTILATKTFDLQSVLSTKCTRAMVAQSQQYFKWRKFSEQTHENQVWDRAVQYPHTLST